MKNEKYSRFGWDELDQLTKDAGDVNKKSFKYNSKYQ